MSSITFWECLILMVFMFLYACVGYYIGRNGGMKKFLGVVDEMIVDAGEKLIINDKLNELGWVLHCYDDSGSYGLTYKRLDGLGKANLYFMDGDWHIEVYRQPDESSFKVVTIGLNSEELYWFNKKIEQLKAEVK